MEDWDGVDVRAWQDCWVEVGECIMDSMEHIPRDVNGVMVYDLVGEDGDWNWRIMEWIPPLIRMKINDIFLPGDNNMRDTFHVSNEEDGSFSIGKMYQYLQRMDGGVANSTWVAIWKLHVPERVWSFIWLIYHDRLLTNHRLNGFGFGNASYSLCGNVCESTLHALRDYKFAKRVWDNVVPVGIVQAFFTGSLGDWIELNLAVSINMASDGASTGLLVVMPSGFGGITSFMISGLAWQLLEMCQNL